MLISSIKRLLLPADRLQIMKECPGDPRFVVRPDFNILFKTVSVLYHVLIIK